MDETLFGKRDKRGHWTPNRRQVPAPVLLWPIQPLRFLRWLPRYLFPWNAAYFGIALLSWVFLTPPLERMREFEAGWMALILLRNEAMTLLVFGVFHTALYIRKRQQTNFKYNSKWPEVNNSAFLFGSQTAENVFWTLCSGVPLWTAYEVSMWWMYANSYIPYIDLEQHPFYAITVILLIPFWRLLHFYLVHRLIHIGPLYHVIHKLHHKNVNPGPWSGLSMHPLEHILYFSGVLLHCIIPSHPLLMMFQLVSDGLSPAQGHLGFDQVVAGDEKLIDTDHYYHYLHHKYFEVNYADRLIPIDWWFGTAHDGSPEAEEAMYKRMKAKKYVR